jgi:hypothetical protein
MLGVWLCFLASRPGLVWLSAPEQAAVKKLSRPDLLRPHAFDISKNATSHFWAGGKTFQSDPAYGHNHLSHPEWECRSFTETGAVDLEIGSRGWSRATGGQLMRLT